MVSQNEDVLEKDMQNKQEKLFISYRRLYVSLDIRLGIFECI